MKIIVTGGAGFIGCNVVAEWMQKGHASWWSTICRADSDSNLAWLGNGARSSSTDRTSASTSLSTRVLRKHRDAHAVVHLAAQVAVTTSVTEPRNDFEINALGTFNVLEAVRKNCPEAAVIYASTNKVYGSLDGAKTAEVGGRYQLIDRPHGIAEDEPLDFHSPYGCSKGAADQYVVDYARIYGTEHGVAPPIVHLRNSPVRHRRSGLGRVVYDRGAAWSRPDHASTATASRSATCSSWTTCASSTRRASRTPSASRGQAYNVGGGPANQLSLLELLAELERRVGSSPRASAARETRPGDQPVFVADIRKAERELGWSPKISVERGTALLFDWVASNRSLVRRLSCDSPRTVRVLELGKYYYPYMGGIEHHLYVLSNELKERVQLEVIVANTTRRTARDQVDGVSVTRCGSFAHVASTSLSASMVFELSRRPYDVLHLHLPNPMGVASYLASRKPNRHRLVVTYHSDVVRQRVLAKALAPLVERVLRRADTIVATSPNYVESSEVLQRFREKTVVIPYGIDLDLYRKTPGARDRSAGHSRAPRRGPAAARVGRLIYYKGFEVAIRALANLPSAHLLIIGDGPLRGELEALATGLGVADA